MNKFYVYAFLDPRKKGNFQYGNLTFEYEPFYVGKGSGKRASEHFRPSEMKRDYNPHKNRKITKITNAGLKPIIKIISNNMNEKDSFSKEVDIIALIGKKKDGGPLTNIYDGGEGCSKSKEQRIKISKKVKEWHSKNKHPFEGKKFSKQHRENISKNRKGISLKKESIEKMKQTKLTTKRPPNTIHWIVVSPEGEEFTVFGLGPFCKNHGLATSHMIAVANGNRNQHKGWKCRKA